MSNKTAEEMIKDRFKFYDPNIYGKDVELNGETVIELMEQYHAQFQSYPSTAQGREVFEWAKASEKLPENNDRYSTIIRMIDDIDGSFPDATNFIEGEWEVDDGYEVVSWLSKYVGESYSREDMEKAAKEKYPEQKGKHWVRVLREEKVKSFVDGCLFIQSLK